MVSRFLFCGRVHPREQDEMEQSGVSTIEVPRAMIFGLILAPLLPGFAAVVGIIGDPRLHGVRGAEIYDSWRSAGARAFSSTDSCCSLDRKPDEVSARPHRQQERTSTGSRPRPFARSALRRNRGRGAAKNGLPEPSTTGCK